MLNEKSMEPLVGQLTKNLSKPCSGCNGDAVYDTWREAKEKGEKMKFQLVIVVEADNYKQAINKIPDEFEILQGGVKPEIKQGIQGSGQFSRTTVQPTPQVNG